jgi:hydrogenase maturation protein HypF
LCPYLTRKPRTLLDAMIHDGINTPRASSCGRLFDAVAAALDICRERQSHEGEAASRLEALICEQTLHHEDESLAYPMYICRSPDNDLRYIEPLPMWHAILFDLVERTPPKVIAARFHSGLARAVAAMTITLAREQRFDTAALSGGCFQNAVLFEQTAQRLRQAGFAVLAHRSIPTNDGGLALGQAAVAAARLIAAPGETA